MVNSSFSELATENFTGPTLSGITTTTSLSAMDSLPIIMGNPEMTALDLSNLQDLGLWATGLALTGIVPAILLLFVLITCVGLHMFCIESGETMAENSDGELVEIDAPVEVWTLTRNKPVAIAVCTIYGMIAMSFMSIQSASPEYNKHVSGEEGFLTIMYDDLFDSLIGFGKELKDEVYDVREYVGANHSGPSNFSDFIDTIRVLEIGEPRWDRSGQVIGSVNKHYEIHDPDYSSFPKRGAIADYCNAVVDKSFRSSRGVTHKVTAVDWPRFPYGKCPEMYDQVDAPSQPYWQGMQEAAELLIEECEETSGVVKNETTKLMESGLWQMVDLLEGYQSDLEPMFKNMNTVNEVTHLMFRIIFGLPLLILPIILFPKTFVFPVAYVCTWCCAGMMFFLLGLYLAIGGLTKGFCIYLDSVEEVGFEESWFNTSAEEVGSIIDAALNQEGFLTAIGADGLFPSDFSVDETWDHALAFEFPKWDAHREVVLAMDTSNAFDNPLECPGDPEGDCALATATIEDVQFAMETVLQLIEGVKAHGISVEGAMLKVEDEVAYFESVEANIENLDRFTELRDLYIDLKQVACNDLIDASALLLWHMVAEGLASLAMTAILVVFTRNWKVLIGPPAPEKPADDPPSDDFAAQKRKSMQGRGRRQSTRSRKEGEQEEITKPQKSRRKPTVKTGSDPSAKKKRRRSVAGRKSIRKNKNKNLYE